MRCEETSPEFYLNSWYAEIPGEGNRVVREKDCEPKTDHEVQKFENHKWNYANDRWCGLDELLRWNDVYCNSHPTLITIVSGWCSARSRKMFIRLELCSTCGSVICPHTTNILDHIAAKESAFLRHLEQTPLRAIAGLLQGGIFGGCSVTVFISQESSNIRWRISSGIFRTGDIRAWSWFAYICRESLRDSRALICARVFSIIGMISPRCGIEVGPDSQRSFSSIQEGSSIWVVKPSENPLWNGLKIYDHICRLKKIQIPAKYFRRLSFSLTLSGLICKNLCCVRAKEKRSSNIRRNLTLSVIIWLHMLRMCSNQSVQIDVFYLRNLYSTVFICIGL